MLPYRGFVVWDAGIFIILGAFLLFVFIGWPGNPDSCVMENACYCEAFDLTAVMRGLPGVRQPVNTWFNLYSIATSFIVALYVYLDRVNGPGQNVIRSNSAIADAYIFAVLFLGLGSMWFHASLTDRLSWLDGLSMYVYAAFLVFYTIRRIWHSDLFFWIAYPTTVVGFTVLGALWKSQYSSLILIVTLVAAYLVFELIAGLKTKLLLGTGRTYLLWGLAVLSIGLATTFWVLSQTGRPLCFPNSFFQPHGLLWHPLAGVMAVLLYFYWREEKPV